MFKNTVIVGTGSRETVADIPALMEGSLHALVVDNKSGSVATIVFHLPSGDLDLPVEAGKSAPTFKLNLPEGFLLEATVPAQVTLSASYIEQAIDDSLAASIAVQAAQDALASQQAAEHAAQDAADEVLAILPEGTINDSITSLVSTWSSEKIAQELEEAGDVKEAPEDGTPYVRQDATWVPLPSGGVAKRTVFNSSGTWTKDQNSKFVFVEAVGAGGGGAASRGYYDYAALGGSGGEYVSKLFPASAVPSSVTVTIGAGGAGALTTAQYQAMVNGSGGGSSSFGSLLQAQGGARGYANTTTNSHRLIAPFGRLMDGNQPAGTVASSDTNGLFIAHFSRDNRGLACHVDSNDVNFLINQGVTEVTSTINGGAAGGSVGRELSTAVFSLHHISKNHGQGGQAAYTNSTASAIGGNGTFPGGGGGAAFANNVAPPMTTTVRAGSGANGQVIVWEW